MRTRGDQRAASSSAEKRNRYVTCAKQAARGTRHMLPGLRSIHDPTPEVLHLTFQVTAPYQFTYTEKRGGMTEILSIHPGAELLGECEPGDADQETILLKDWNYVWRIPRADVQISRLSDSLIAAQRTIAFTRNAQAKEAIARKDYQAAERLYAQACVELVEASTSFRTIGQARMERAICLICIKAEDAQIVAQLEQAATVYDWAFDEWSVKLAHQHIEVADEASQVQIFLAQMYLALEEHEQALACVEHVLAWNKRITKRYTRKVELLLLAVDLLFQLGETKKGSSVLKTADRFFQQQVIRDVGFDKQATQVEQLLKKLKAQGQSQKQPFSFTVTADTADDMQTLLNTLQAAQIKGLTLPTNFGQKPKGLSSRHGVISSAKLRLQPTDDRQ